MEKPMEDALEEKQEKPALVMKIVNLAMPAEENLPGLIEQFASLRRLLELFVILTMIV